MTIELFFSPEEAEQERLALQRVNTTVAERWHVDELLGMGGMAAVYAVTHHNGCRMALKILRSELAHVSEVKERFLDEAYAANDVHHVGTVPVLDDGVTADGCAFLVMDLLEGETLDARLQRAGRALSSHEVLAVVAPLLEVLTAAHEHGTVHRDVKPGNVFLTTAGEVKLLDFGIARMLESRRTLRTQTGVTLGTPAFMAPEHARGRWDEVDARADLWSVGATMFMLLTGRMVHKAGTINEQLLAAMTLPAPSIRSVAPMIPEAVAEIVDQSLAFRPQDRFADASAMGVAVRRAHLEIEADSVAHGRVSWPPLAGGLIAPAYEVSEGRPTCRPASFTESADHQARRHVLPGVALGAALTVAGVSAVVWWPHHAEAVAASVAAAPEAEVEGPSSLQPRLAEGFQEEPSGEMTVEQPEPVGELSGLELSGSAEVPKKAAQPRRAPARTEAPAPPAWTPPSIGSAAAAPPEDPLGRRR